MKIEIVYFINPIKSPVHGKKSARLLSDKVVRIQLAKYFLRILAHFGHLLGLL